MRTARGHPVELSPTLPIVPGQGAPPWGWGCTPHPAGLAHVWPFWDIRTHYLCETCWCKPVLDERGAFLHNAADGRERYELAGALRN